MSNNTMSNNIQFDISANDIASDQLQNFEQILSDISNKLDQINATGQSLGETLQNAMSMNNQGPMDFTQNILNFAGGIATLDLYIGQVLRRGPLLLLLLESLGLAGTTFVTGLAGLTIYTEVSAANVQEHINAITNATKQTQDSTNAAAQSFKLLGEQMQAVANISPTQRAAMELAEFEAKTEAARRVAGEFLNIKTENQIAGEIQNSIDAYGRFISKVGITEEEVGRAFDALAEKLKSLDVDPEVMDKLLNDIKEKSPELTELIDELNASVGGLGGAYDALGIVPVDEIKKQAQEAIDHLETIRKKHGKNSSEYSQGLEAVNKEVEDLKKAAPEAVSELKNIPVGVDGKVYEDTKKKIGDLIVNGEKMILPGVDAASADKVQKAFDKLGKKETKVYEVVYKVKNKPNDPSTSADPEEYADGGSVFRRLSSPVIASGSGVKDDVPAMLMRGEFVQQCLAC